MQLAGCVEYTSVQDKTALKKKKNKFAEVCEGLAGKFLIFLKKKIYIFQLVPKEVRKAIHK